MSMRKVVCAAISLGAAATMASTATATATPAPAPAAQQAACAVTIHLPAKIKIAAAHNKYGVQLTGCEAPGLFVAVAELDSPSGKFWDALGWDHTHRTSVLDFPASDHPNPGRYTVRQSSEEGFVCSDSSCTAGGDGIDFTNAPSTDLRYGTLVGIATSCSSTKIVVRGLLKRWVGSQWVNYPNRLVTLKQYKNGGWASVGYVHSDANGKLVGIVKRTAGAKFRWGLPDSASYWGTSSVVGHC
jgi:hypothetical protein